MSDRKKILKRLGIRILSGVLGALAVWLAGSEFAEIVGPQWGALIGGVVGPILYDLRAAIKA